MIKYLVYSIIYKRLTYSQVITAKPEIKSDIDSMLTSEGFSHLII